MTTTFQFIGERTLNFLLQLGEVAGLAGKTLASILQGRIRWRLTFRQLVEIGYGSQLVVAVTGSFTGAVFAAQTYYQFHLVQLDSAVGAVVSVSMCRELGPVLTALMVAGRVGAAITAEIGTMKVTEQIDALRAMAISPVEYLVVPRTLAMVVSMPLLVAQSIGFGILLGYVVGVHLMGITGAYYVDNMIKFTELDDVLIGVIKGFVFAIIIVIIACHQGLKASRGAVGVGRRTTSSVVISSLCCLIVNFFLTILLNIFIPA